MEAPVLDRPIKTLLAVPASQRAPMSRSQSEVFIQTSMMQNAGGDHIGTTGELRPRFEEKGSMPAQVAIMLGRLDLAEAETRFSFATILFLAYLSDNPGRVVMWAHYLVQRTYETGALVDNDRLAGDFPMGFPTGEGASAIWAAQKARPGERPENRLDSVNAWRRAA